jgi:hypothetical protein
MSILCYIFQRNGKRLQGVPDPSKANTPEDFQRYVIVSLCNPKNL